MTSSKPQYDLIVTPADIGRRVIYHGPYKNEEGTITSFNDHYVFVRFGDDRRSHACRRDTVEYTHS